MDDSTLTDVVGTALRFLAAAGVPWWALVLAAVLLAALIVVLPGWIRWVIANIKVEPVVDDPSSDSGLPPAVGVDSNGTVIDPSVSGRPPENESGSGG